MKKLIRLSLIISGIVLLDQSQALAWGPGVHLALANCLFNNLSLLLPHVAQILLSHPEQYLYGSLSADIFIGKGVKAKPRHSHNWRTGHKILDAADSRKPLAAHGLGYLAHLAADVVAHNHYVPNMLVKGAGNGKFSHILLEYRADLNLNWCGEQARKVFNLKNKEVDALLVRAMGHTRLGFEMRKLLFRQGLSLGPNGMFSANPEFVDRILPGRTDEEYFMEMFRLSLAAVVDVLSDPHGSRITELDPIGEIALRSAKNLPGFGGSGESCWPFPLDQRLQDLPSPFSSR